LLEVTVAIWEQKNLHTDLTMDQSQNSLNTRKFLKLLARSRLRASPLLRHRLSLSAHEFCRWLSMLGGR
jgi:hypothetical protein